MTSMQTLKAIKSAHVRAQAAILNSGIVHVGMVLPRIGSVVPNGGKVIATDYADHSAHFTIRETLAGTDFVRKVRFATYRHALKCMA